MHMAYLRVIILVIGFSEYHKEGLACYRNFLWECQ